MSFWDLKTARFLILVLIIFAAILLGVSLPGDSRLIHSIQDSGHFIIFTILTLVILSLYRKSEQRTVWLLMLFILLFGVLVEVVQSYIGREPSLYDLLMDLLGIAAGAILYAGFFRRSLSWSLSIVILLAFTLTAFSMPLHWFILYQARASQFPRLIDVDNLLSRSLLEGSEGGKLRYIEVPENWSLPVDSDIETCAYVSLHNGSWPGVEIREPEPDWRGYDSLELSIYSDQPEELSLVLRIHDKNHNQVSDDRYNQNLLLQPGYNHYSLPLSEIVQAPLTRTMEQQAISGVILFAPQKCIGRSFCLISMELR
ncbi:MAG: VanZ family protein [Candidatus Thiodiazotropha sp.]